MTECDVEEQWVGRQLYDAHASMQAFLSRGDRSVDNALQLAEVRTAFRAVNALWELAEDCDNWYTTTVPGDEILRGIRAQSQAYVRMRNVFEVPAAEAGRLLVQPEESLPCFVPGLVVDAVDGDRVDARVRARMPSSVSKRLDTCYHIRQRVFAHSEARAAVFVLWEDIEDSDGHARFGAHLLALEPQPEEEVRLTVVLDMSATPFRMPVLGFQWLYFSLGRVCERLRETMTAFYMRHPSAHAALRRAKQATFLQALVENGLALRV